MSNMLFTIISKKDVNDFKEFVSFILHQEKKLFNQNDLLLAFYQFCDRNDKKSRFRSCSKIAAFFKKIHEVVVNSDHICMRHRFSTARSSFYRLCIDGEHMEEITAADYLDQKDRLVLKDQYGNHPLRIDFLPFYDFSPTIRYSKAIGNGIQFLNRFLSSKIFNNPQEWNAKLFDFLKLHKYRGQQLLVNGDIIKEFDQFYSELKKVLDWLKSQPADRAYGQVMTRLKRQGFEPGWGNRVSRMVETMQILVDLINAPDDSLLEEFIARVPLPLMSKIAIISPHGWFAQEKVLGKPDTGGQVIYILEQVRALEIHLKEQIRLSGFEVDPHIIVVTRLIPNSGETTCNQKKEKIYHTDNCWILRIPFVDNNFNIHKDWLSRFEVWPYLDRFAEQSATELLSQFGGRPDLIIGNYSDGNLVATLLSDRLNVIQCNISHALEKNKYPQANLHWQQWEKDYHFSLQFIADILSMNKADFVITSTLQEIFGTDETIGQYESYQLFTMPGLVQIISGVNLFAPKFNVIPPGVDETIYFPYYLHEKRIQYQQDKWRKRLFHENDPSIFGWLEEPEKPAIFTMARLDKVKNISGLIEAYGGSRKLQKKYNLIIAAGTHDVNRSQDREEKEMIMANHRLIKDYKLDGKIRWLPSIKKLDTGEVYRIIADKGGIFVQPALYEAFGLTVLEAMLSGLPTFGPKFGGPSEIIQYGVNGLLLNTSRPELIARGIEKFMEQCVKDKTYWKQISDHGIDRVREKYNWRLYSERLVKLAKLYGFWRFSLSAKGKEKMDRYCDFIYHFLYKQRADKLLD